MPKPTITDAVKELKREYRVRERVYPDWIKLCKITPGDATWQQACLKEAIERLEKLDKELNGDQKSLF